MLGKRTYRFTPGGKAVPDRAEPVPFFETDLFHGKSDPALDPPRQESDLCDWKPKVDVVVHGLAHAPRGKLGHFFDAFVAVGGTRAGVRVFGNRRVDMSRGSPRFTDPEPFASMPLHWGLAYGGVDRWTHPDIALPYPKNPVGKGFAVAPEPQFLHGMELPNLEDPQNPIQPGSFLLRKFERWMSGPEPFALGWMPRGAHIRRQVVVASAGKDGEAARERERISRNLPLATPDAAVPVDRNPRDHAANNGALPLLRFPRLAGDEPVSLVYMDPDHPRLDFALGGDAPLGYLRLAKEWVELPMVATTLEIYPQTRQLTLVWRGSARYPGIRWLAEREDKIRFKVRSRAEM